MRSVMFLQRGETRPKKSSSPMRDDLSNQTNSHRVICGSCKGLITQSHCSDETSVGKKSVQSNKTHLKCECSEALLTAPSFDTLTQKYIGQFITIIREYHHHAFFLFSYHPFLFSYNPSQKF